MVKHFFDTLNRIQGWCDSLLTEKGRDQARQIRAYFDKYHMTFDHYYCTTTERASDTLELATGPTDYKRVKGLKSLTSVSLRGNRSIFILKLKFRAISVTIMFSLAGKVKPSL